MTRYTPAWSEHGMPAGRNASGSWQPVPWQQDGSRAVALIGAETYCSYGAAFDGVSDPGYGIGPNTSGWSYPGRSSQMPACLNQ